MFSRLLAIAFAAAPAPGAASEVPADHSTPPTLSVSELGSRHASLIGQRVKVEGFLLLRTGRPALAQGVFRKSQVYFSRRSRQADHWCAFDSQPRPIAVHDLPAESISKVEKFARRKGVLVAQRVILEGVVGQASDVVYEPAIYHPYESVGNYEVAGLHRTHLVAVEPVFCSGVLYKY